MFDAEIHIPNVTIIALPLCTRLVIYNDYVKPTTQLVMPKAGYVYFSEVPDITLVLYPRQRYVFFSYRLFYLTLLV